MTCRITIDDGINLPVVLDDQVLALDVDDAPLPGGGSVVRFLDGSSNTQERWAKRGWTVSGRATYKPGLKDLITSGLLTLTIEAGVDTDVHVCRSRGASEQWGVRGSGLVGFSMVLEEA